MNDISLTTFDEKEIKAYIRGVLTVNGQRLRFDMSGYDGDKKGACTLQNQAILNLFAHLGIYDYTRYLFLDFYQGLGEIYLQYWLNKEPKIVDVSGYGTVDIIHMILKNTVLSARGKRRRK